MIEGIKCPPATHNYKPHGKIALCRKCGDVQPLLLDSPDENVSRGTLPPPNPLEPQWPPEIPMPPQTIPASDEAQMDMLRSLRELVAQGGTPSPEQLDLLGQRHPYDGDMSDLELMNRSNEREWPRVPVTTGYEGDARDESLPSAGL